MNECVSGKEAKAVCNLYAELRSQWEIMEAAEARYDRTGNLPRFPSIFPDYAAPIVRNSAEGRELVMARWGMPSPSVALKGRQTDHGVTNIRNLQSPHWRRWLSAEHRCIVPFTSFSENQHFPDGSRTPVWYAFNETRPLVFLPAFGRAGHRCAH